MADYPEIGENAVSDTANTENTEELNEPVSDNEPQGEVTEPDWKALARKWEARAKAAKADSDDAAKWREYELSQKSEHEQISEKLAAAEAAAANAVAKLTRYEVAASKGVPAEAIELLTGTTKEELEAAADKLLALIANQSKAAPKPDVNQGKPAKGGNTTAEQFASALANVL